MAGRCGTEAAPFEFHEEVEVHLGDYPEVWLVHGVLALWIRTRMNNNEYNNNNNINNISHIISAA